MKETGNKWKWMKGAAGMLLLVLSISKAEATHIRAGEIRAVRVDNFSRTYEFTVTGFRDSGSSIPFGGGLFLFGDGTSESGPFRTTNTDVGNNIELVTFTVTHTFDAFNGNGYLVSYQEEFRNADIINMSNSVGTTFYVESLIIIDPLFGINNSPVLTVPPIDFAAVGALFIHNPGAYDPDGDSLSYSFTTPKQGKDKVVDQYRKLNDPSFYSSFATGSENGDIPGLTLNPITGDLIWDAPGDAFVAVKDNPKQREYNIAFIIKEWRVINGTPYLQGYVVRDMQIIVEDTDNQRPTLEVPEDFCVEAKTKAEFIAQGDDPDGDPVKLEAFGGPFEVDIKPATYTTPPGEQGFQGPPGFLTFEWNTDCSHIRERPYEVQIKVTDKPASGPKLVDFETIEIIVVGPAPTGLTTTVQPGKSILLNWDGYSCSNLDRMQIWRKVGKSDIVTGSCDIGMPANTGFELIDEVDGFTTEYLDNNAGIGLSAGATYCYRLVASFPFPGGGESYVSLEACDSILIDVPIITNVDIKKTSSDAGEVFVRWTPPYQIDQVVFPPAYTYDLFRFEGQKAVLDNAALVSLQQIASNISDTTFTDTGLNTLNQTYTYFVKLYANNIQVDTSAFASTIRLNPKPLTRSIELTWNAVVPWSLRSNAAPYHYVYRDQVLDIALDSLVLIDSVNVTSKDLLYLDNGSFNNVSLDEEIEYCYYVVTNGTYDNRLLPDPLINSSQIACAEPNDSIPPCRPPVVTLNDLFDCNAFFADKECGYSNFKNTLKWTVDVAPNCDNDIQYYNVYFSGTGVGDDFEVVGTSFSTEFIHDDISSFKGCYKISAVDRSGNESELTEAVCLDNCPFYSLPNAFTPNGDGINDTFTPLYSSSTNPISGFDKINCPRFVDDVQFIVFDRSGNKIYEYISLENDRDILINWKGTNQAGTSLPEGVYFYEAKVTFDVLDSTKKDKTFKGWVQILK